MLQDLQIKDHEEHNQKLWIGPLIPLQRHFYLSFVSVLLKALTSDVVSYNSLGRLKQKVRYCYTLNLILKCFHKFWESTLINLQVGG